MHLLIRREDRASENNHKCHGTVTNMFQQGVTEGHSEEVTLEQGPE